MENDGYVGLFSFTFFSSSKLAIGFFVVAVCALLSLACLTLQSDHKTESEIHVLINLYSPNFGYLRQLLFGLVIVKTRLSRL